VRVTLLGSWSLTGVPDGAAPLLARRLVTYLSLRGPAPREEVAAALWPDAASQRASGSLRTALWRVRAVHPRLVTCDGDSARLHPDVRVDVDELVEDVRRLDAGELPPRLRALPRYLLDGDLASGWYDDWILLERERVRQLRLHALEGLALALAEEGRFCLALEAALAAVRSEPLRESAHRVVVLVHLREGNRSEALRHLEGYRVLLDRELGVPPSPALLRLLDSGAYVPQQRRRDEPC
jgi:DNA-binding SARP family transcriptional activator